MGQFDEQLSTFRRKEEDEWKRFFLKHERDESAEIRALFGSKAFGGQKLADPKYLNAANSKKQEAVFKIIPGGNVGRERITTLARYVTRRLPHQEGQDEIQLHDSLGRELSDEGIEMKLNQWIKHFEAPKGLAKQQWKLDVLARMEDERNVLQDKDLNELPAKERQKTVERIAELNRFITGKFYEKPRWFQKVISNEETSRARLEKVLNSRYAAFRPIDKNLLGFDSQMQFGIKHDTPKKIDLNVKVKDDFKHLLFSPGGKHNEKVLKYAFQDFISRTFEAQGFEVMYALHQDTDNDHFHVILNARSKLHSKNKQVENGNPTYFHPDIADLHALREEFAYSMSKYGISRVATRRKDRPETLQLIREGVENLKQSKSWYDAQTEPSSGKPAYNVIKSRASMLKSIDFLQRQESFGANLKSLASGKSAQYDEDRTLLKDLKKELLQPLSPSQIEATMRKFEKQHSQLSKKLQEVGEDLRSKDKAADKSQLKRKRSSFELLEKTLDRDIAQAIEVLKKSRTAENADEVKKSLKRLQEMKPSTRRIKIKR